MAKKVFDDTYVKEIADSIRTKLGTTDTFKISEMGSKVDSIPTGITPTGELSITSNGDYDVAEYATANVNVSGGSSSITFTGSYDAEGLKEMGWTDDDIAYANAHGVTWDKEDNDIMKVNDRDKLANNVYYGRFYNKNVSTKIVGSNARRSMKAMPKLETSGAALKDFVSLITIYPFDCSNLKSFDNMFNGCYSLIEFPEFNTSTITSMMDTCYNCYSLKSFPKIDTSNVTSMYQMFYSCYSLSKVAQIDTSKVTNMYQMFYNCYSLEELPLLNMENVTDSSYMFQYCKSLKRLPNLNLKNVDNASYMFSDCSALISIPQLDLSKATNLTYMFSACYSLTNVPEFDVPSATNLYGTFMNCFSLLNPPITNTRNATNVTYLYSNCYSIIEFPDMEFPKTTDLKNAFSSCYGAKKIGKITAPLCTSMYSTFYQCTSLASLDLSGVKLSNVTATTRIFSSCGTSSLASDGAYADGITYVYVQDEEDQTWLLNLTARPSTWTSANVVIAGSEADTRTS